MNAIEVAQRYVNACDCHTDAILAVFAEGVWAAFPAFSRELISLGETAEGLLING
jgi:hypothetical protein